MLGIHERAGFGTPEKSHFQAPKIKKICWTTSINRLHSFHQ